MPNTLSELIRSDHREFRRMFSELRLPATRPLIAPMLVALLGAHARSEEAHVYPALRDRVGAPDAVEHSQEEHVEGDRLAAQLADTPLDDPKFDDILDKLVDSVSHHLEEEEESVLPKLDQLSDADQQSVTESFLKTRAQHLCAGVTDLSKNELRQQAINEGVDQASSMNKEELQESLRASH